MIVFLGSPRGFCAGVVRAIDSVEIAIEKYGPPIYVKHQIVHNSYVVNQLEQKGANVFMLTACRTWHGGPTEWD